eukprot:scaffold246530_cov18-Tisochrysis_lutea.AAC.1
MALPGLKPSPCAGTTSLVSLLGALDSWRSGIWKGGLRARVAGTCGWLAEASGQRVHACCSQQSLQQGRPLLFSWPVCSVFAVTDRKNLDRKPVLTPRSLLDWYKIKDQSGLDQTLDQSGQHQRPELPAVQYVLLAKMMATNTKF